MEQRAYRPASRRIRLRTKVDCTPRTAADFARSLAIRSLTKADLDYERSVFDSCGERRREFRWQGKRLWRDSPHHTAWECTIQSNPLSFFSTSRDRGKRGNSAFHECVSVSAFHECVSVWSRRYDVIARYALSGSAWRTVS